MRHGRVFFPFLGVLCLCAHGEDVAVRYGGRLAFPESCVDVHPVAFASSGWKQIDGTGESRPSADGSVSFDFRMSDADTIDVEGILGYHAKTNGTLAVRYSFRAVRDVALNSIGLYILTMPDDYVGGQVCLDGKSTSIPLEGHVGQSGEIAVGTCRCAELVGTRGRRLSLRFDSPVVLRVRDERRTRGYANLTLWAEIPGRRRMASGDECAVSMTIDCGHPLAPHVTEKPYKVSAENGWTHVSFLPDVMPESALDFSVLRGTGRPAGKYGRVVVRDGHFEFEKSPGITRRFFGVNLCNDANYPPTMEVARALAARLARNGYNAVRIHHHDSPMVSKSNDGLTVNPEMRRRFDMFVAACIEEGLYLTTDFYVSRWIALPTVGRNIPGLMPNGEFKSLVCVDEHVFGNYIRFVREFMTHVNPFTGRSLAEESALACVSLVNEGNHGNNMGIYRKYPEWGAAWKAWLAAEKRRDPSVADLSDTIPDNIIDGSVAARAFARFLAERERMFVERVRKIVKDELKCPVPITNMNFGYGVQPEEFRPIRETTYDYVDEHYYVGHPLGIFGRRGFPSAMAPDGGNSGNPLRGGERGAVRLGERRVPGNPYTVTEYNWCYPCRFRGACGLAVGARAASCDWSGIWRFAWASDMQGVTNAGRNAIGVFDVAADPLAQAADRATAALFLRGDLAGGRHRFILEKGALAIDTPFTSGGAAESGVIDGGALRADVGEGFAGVWATTLDGNPFSETRRILLTHLTDLQNEGAVFDDDGLTVGLRGGGPGKMARNGKANVSVAVVSGDWRVWALDSTGRRMGIVPAEWREGRLHLIADVAVVPAQATWCYELARINDVPFIPGERVAFFGDSITHIGSYIQYLQLWENLRHPGSGVRFMNCGIGGDTAKTGIARFDADLLQMKPDRVFVMFGMNDVGRENYATASPTEAQTAARERSLADYAQNMEMVAARLAVAKLGAVFMTPTPYDQYMKAKGENLAQCNEPGLASCAEIVRDLAAKHGNGLVELHRPMTDMFKRNTDFRFCADRVHPGNEGHLVMAAHILRALGTSPRVAMAEIDAVRLIAGNVENARVTAITKSGDGISFTYEPRSLPFPTLPEYMVVEKNGFYSLSDTLNREEIAVIGLEKGEYELRFDGRTVARFSADELAYGVNVATLDTENQRRAQKAAKPMCELRDLESRLRDYALLVNLARKAGISESDHDRTDAYLDQWLTNTRMSPYHSTFSLWVKSYRDVRAKKKGLEVLRERLREQMASERPVAERVEIRRIR